MPLNDMQIRRAKPEDKPYTLGDGQGLSLLIEPNGSKSWRFRYRFAGKPKMISLGVYPTITLADARSRRDEARKLVAEGMKWFTEFGHLNRGDMLTSEQYRCHNEKKKFQRRV